VNLEGSREASGTAVGHDAGFLGCGASCAAISIVDRLPFAPRPAPNANPWNGYIVGLLASSLLARIFEDPQLVSAF